MKFIKLISALLLVLSLISCGTGGGTTGDKGTVTLKMKADFQTSVFPAPKTLTQFAAAPAINACPSPALTMDQPGYAAGLDCDNDDGIIQYITPSSFKVAFKRLTFIKDDGTPIDIIPDKGTLASSADYDLTTVITVSTPALALPVGNYTAIRAEIYYYEIKMPINNPSADQTLRIYLSDDDFPQEGNLGHHQGDITFIDSNIDSNGTELGWIPAEVKWITNSLQSSSTGLNRPGGNDPETDHQRGLFGNAEMWNQSDFQQGSSKDIFVINAPFSLSLAKDATSTITVSFSLKDSWFYEDFDGNQKFNPCDNTSDACAANAEWSPILPNIVIQ